MASVVTTVSILGALEPVFDLVTTARFWPQWHPASQGVAGVTQRPFRLGDVIHERGEIAGIQFYVAWTVVEHARPTRVTLQSQTPPVRITYFFHAKGEATEFTRQLDYDPRDFRVTVPDPDPDELQRLLHAQSEQALHQLKELVERILREEVEGLPNEPSQPITGERKASSVSAGPMADLASYPLLTALLERRSRRFGKGMRLNGGPLAYQSRTPPQPLTLEEEAVLAFAACGISGYALAELPYESGAVPESGSGNIMTHFIARTVASGDAMHYVILFVINDEGVWMLRRPQDLPRMEIPELIDKARRHGWVELYERSRVQISDKRLDVPREVPFVAPFNKYSANLPGTTYFLPVNEFTAIYINVLLSAFNEEFALFVADDRNSYRPAGLSAFARSRGGYLDDNPKDGRILTVSFLENWLCEFAAIEQGGMLQNLALMTQAMGLGGFPHFAAHPAIWPQTLGFRMEAIPFSRTMGAGPGKRLLLRLLGRDLPVPTAVGLERNGEPLIKPYCPPYYHDMREAVLAFVEYKYANGTGTLRDGGAVTGWREGAAVQAGIPRYSEETIAATIAYCEYVYQRYGRFPAASGPFRTILAHQAHHLDLDFYDKFYRPETLSPTQREHPQRWHGKELQS